MQKVLVLVSLLICVLVTSSCGSTGQAVKPTAAPSLPPLPPNLAAPPETGKKVRAELFKPQTSAMPK